MFGCFRKGEANDPEIYVAAIIRILQEFSEEVVEHVTSPITGLPRQIDFLPTLREVDQACKARRQWCIMRDEMMAKGFRLDTEAMRWVKSA